MNKYYFINIGAEVIWHPENSDEQKVVQICTSVSYPVENDTLVSLIFSDVDITRIMSTYNNDKVLFQAHYVPTSQYTSPSFGDERLLPTDYWITLVKPDYYLLDNNGKDLYMFKTKPAPTRR